MPTCLSYSEVFVVEFYWVGLLIVLGLIVLRILIRKQSSADRNALTVLIVIVFVTLGLNLSTVGVNCTSATRSVQVGTFPNDLIPLVTPDFTL